MTILVTRAQWGAVPPRAVSHDVQPTEGVVIHHVGASSYAYPQHAACVTLVRDIQRMHLANTSEGYVDIAYSMLACHHGYMFEGRSKASDPKVRPGSNGTNHANTVALSVCCLWGDDDGAPTQAILDAAAGAVRWLRAQADAAKRVTGHRDWSSTSCPGRLYPHLGTIAALADKQEQPLPIIVGTWNVPHRLDPRLLAPDIAAATAAHNVGLWALQETTDTDYRILKPDGWDWWRPKRAQSSTLIFDPDVWEPLKHPNGARRQGAFRVHADGDRPRHIVYAVLRHRSTSKVFKVGGVHLPAFKTRSPRQAAWFRHAQKRAAVWMGRGGPDRVLLGDLNANRSLVWTPQLNRVAVWEKPRNNGTGPSGAHIDHVLRKKNRRRRPTVVATVKGRSDHDALIVEL